MEYNIDRSSSVSMFKKERKLDDGKVVWDSVVKLRKKNPAECSKYPKKHLGVRNNWIKDFSNMLSDKASSYVLETMSAKRTSRQEEIAQTLLDRFNNFLEQDASMKEPRTITHKAMVMMADRLSLWLDKNVKVSKSATLRLRQMEEEEKKRRLMEEMARIEQERRDREEERKRKMAEEAAKKLEDEIINPSSETEPDLDRSADDGQAEKGPDTGDEKPSENDDKPPTMDEKPDEGPPDGQQSPDQEPPQLPPPAESNDQKSEGPTEDQTDASGAQQMSEELQEEKVNETDDNVGKTDEQLANEELVKIDSEIFVEPDLTPESPLRNILDNGEDTVSSNYPAPDVTQSPSEALDGTPSAIPTSGSEFSDGDYMDIEPSKDSATLVQELLEEKDTVDEEDIAISLIGKAVNEKTDKVLQELAEIIATTKEEHSPLQEAIKDMMGKELEDLLGDKDAEAINEVAGKVGTWIDKMVERAAEEYGEARSASRGRYVSPRSASPMPHMPEVGTYVPQAHKSATMMHVPQPNAASPEGLAESSFETVSSRFPHAPVSQKPKGPIFELRKVDTKNIFNVAGVTHTKAKRKIRQARGLASSSRRVSQESLDIEEWAEWAGLVSDVGKNWAKWIEEVAQLVDRPSNDNEKSLIAHDAKEWKSISKELQREGDIWMKKVVKKQSKHTKNKSPDATPLSV